jgi:hypothetical protein
MTVVQPLASPLTPNTAQGKTVPRHTLYHIFFPTSQALSHGCLQFLPLPYSRQPHCQGPYMLRQAETVKRGVHNIALFNLSTQDLKKKKNHSTQDSRVVPHRGTN